ncbi:MAG: tRNA (adenosine(37)-N6)-threonylcarbamoyltransferase complex transferase subunit TsaD [Acidobacteria bacterium RIFCSPLOWO2_12_FULL_60_22]|nr:MAG: tRNA (adenosine(37)-N6)-threonylcarbamoyltransferase complex transferase subunit TsaD [Acidobacteria bacterium RIFCSPLOWO2_12_FULL_60_22]
MEEEIRIPAEATPPIRILGIETSCDETAAAVVEGGVRICSSVVASQIATHGKYGGVVPELASREHLRAIVPVVRQAVEEAGLHYSQLDAIAVTQGPGLVGALLVGLTYAKSLALALGKPLVAVNHLEGHIHAVILEERLNQRPEPEFPALALVVSGGHTLLAVAERSSERDSVSAARSVPAVLAVPAVYSVPAVPSVDSDLFTYRILGRTRDDAAGEAYDKVAKLLGLGYPGGPVLDQLARHGNPDAVAFTKPKMKTTKTAKGKALDFSFSGIKTAVLRYVEARGLADEIAERNAFRKQNPRAGLDELVARCSRTTLDLVASFQKAVVDDLVEHCLAAAEREAVNSIFVTGGVAANSLLRERFSRLPGSYPPVYFPRLSLSTDNAAMIAAAAFPKFQAGQFAAWDVPPDASLALGS